MASGFTSVPLEDDDVFDARDCNIIGEAWLTNLFRFNHHNSDLGWFVFERIVPFAKTIAPDVVGLNRTLKIANGAGGTRAAVITAVSHSESPCPKQH
jgi:hypothetical protein